jgi:hypothetical protein
MNALDVNNGSSSWNSEGNNSTETSLLLRFDRPVIPATLKLQFQAGFAAESCAVFYSNETNPTAGETMPEDEFELKDVHEVQSFDLLSSTANRQPVTAIKFVLDNFCDFYGRVILYKLEVWGREMGDC